MCPQDTYVPTGYIRTHRACKRDCSLWTWELPSHTQLLPDARVGCPAKVSLRPQFLHWHNKRTAFIIQANVLEAPRSILLLIQ